MNDSEKLIRTMKRDHAKLLKQYDEAIAAASVGTGTHTRLLEAKSKANQRHREELVKFGVVAQDLGRQTRTEYLFVSHIAVAPANRDELQKMLGQQMQKSCEGLRYSEQDEAIREHFEKDFPTNAK